MFKLGTRFQLHNEAELVPIISTLLNLFDWPKTSNQGTPLI